MSVWEGDIPYFVRTCPGQIGISDRRIYYSAAVNYLTNDGVLIDTGTLAGGTSVALAAGAMQSGKAIDRKLIHAFDLFQCDWSTPDFFRNAFGGTWKQGDNFRHVYNSVTGPFSRFIEAHEGDLLAYPEWDGTPIDVLGVDVWKTEPLALHMMRVFFPSLRIGSVVLQQDYRTVWLPWVHTLMEAMSDFFVRTHESADNEGSTVVFTLKKPISAADVERVIESHRSIEARRELAKRAAAASHRPSTSVFVDLAHAITERDMGGAQKAADWLEGVSIPDTIAIQGALSELKEQMLAPLKQAAIQA